MNIEEIKSCIRAFNIAFLENEPLKNHTSFKIGGAACVFAMPKNYEEVAFLKKLEADFSTPLVTLGHGTNVLAPDEGIPLVMYIGEGLSEITLEGNEITAQGGALLSTLCLLARDRGLSGLEFAYGIPASVGGAVIMNSGAYGGEVGDCIKSVKAMDNKNRIVTFSKDECEFGYRKSLFSQGFTVLEATFSLKTGDKAEISEKMEEILNTRRMKQPLNYPSAGSTFKRPRDNFAAALIDQCGLKGLSVGDAQVSPMHAGFVINKGHATAREVKELCCIIQETVFKEKGISLTLEIKIL